METTIKENTRMVAGVATESRLKQRVSDTKDFGWLVKSLGLAQQFTQTAIVTRVNGWTTNVMVKAPRLTKMGEFILETLKKIANMGLALLRGRQESVMRVIMTIIS